MDATAFTAKQQEEERGDSSARGGPFFQLVYNEQYEPAAQMVRCPGLAFGYDAAAGLSAGTRPTSTVARLRRRNP